MKNKKEITIVSICWALVILIVSILVKDHPHGPFFYQFTVTGAISHYFLFTTKRKGACH